MKENKQDTLRTRTHIYHNKNTIQTVLIMLRWFQWVALDSMATTTIQVIITQT
jgi:hypothetical protein